MELTCGNSTPVDTIDGSYDEVSVLKRKISSLEATIKKLKFQRKTIKGSVYNYKRHELCSKRKYIRRCVEELKYMPLEESITKVVRPHVHQKYNFNVICNQMCSAIMSASFLNRDCRKIL